MNRDSYAGGVTTRPNDLNVLGRTQRVLAYDHDPSREGRPVMLLLGGAAVALLCLVLIGALSYRTFYEHRIDPDQAYFGISFLFCFYVFGVFLFCYGYELYDMPRALRLTLIASFISLLFLVLAIVSLTYLAKMKDGVSAVAGEADSATDGSLANTLFSFMGPTTDREAEERDRRRRRGGFEDFITPDARPFLVNCQGCGEIYTPVPPKAACPHCGRAAVPG